MIFPPFLQTPNIKSKFRFFIQGKKIYILITTIKPQRQRDGGKKFPRRIFEHDLAHRVISTTYILSHL